MIITINKNNWILLFNVIGRNSKKCKQGISKLYLIYFKLIMGYNNYRFFLSIVNTLLVVPNVIGIFYIEQFICFVGFGLF